MKPFTPETLAERWQCSANTVRSLIKAGDLKAERVGRAFRILPDVVAAFEATPMSPAATAEPLPPTDGFDVYVIQSGDYIKIGKATFVADRLAGLQTSTPHDLVLLHVIKGREGTKLEMELHRRFAAHRHRNEWFRHEGALAEWIAAGCPL